MWRNKVISIINIVGLAVGFSVFLTFWIMIKYEKDFDTFHKNYNKIARVRIHFKMNNGEFNSDKAGVGYGEALKGHYPEIIDACTFSVPQTITIGVNRSNADSTNQRKYFIEKLAIAIDTNFFNVFSFPILRQLNKSIFANPQSILLTESTAKKMFGDDDPLGKTVDLGLKAEYTISGIVKDPPKNSTIQFNCLLPLDYLKQVGQKLEEIMVFCYVLLSTKESIEPINYTITDFIHTACPNKEETSIYLEPFSRAHLYGEDLQYLGVYFYTIIALIIIAIACINFINLTVAHSSTRIKEVGVRKVIGASRWNLITQFLGETFVICTIAFYLGIIIAEQLLEKFSAGSSQAITINYNDPVLWIQLISILLTIVLISGLYPAFVLSGFRPVAIFQRRNLALKSGGGLKKVLVTVQFATSVFFIVTSIFASRQFKYMQTADLGFTRENIIFIPTRGQVWHKYNLIHDELLKNPVITGVSTVSDIPWIVQESVFFKNKHEDEHGIDASFMQCGYDFNDVLNIKMLNGRFYSKTFTTDTVNAVVVNQNVVEMMGWKEPIGQSLYISGKKYRVIGVTEDIKFFPFKVSAFSNALIYAFNDVNSFVFIKYNGHEQSKAVEYTKMIFEKYNSGYEFEYFFADDSNYSAIPSSKSISKIFWFATLIGFFISSIGMLGLAIHSANRRVKEIGIRKSFGANSNQIFRIVISEFLKLVFIANLIGLSLAWIILNMGLQYCVYRINLSGFVFAFAFIVSIVIAFLTIGYIAYKAARQNPVISLRYE
jgi:putative ABC transport system permease protein